MTVWKISRHCYGSEEYKFKEGDEVTIGRAISNTIPLTSIVISRQHCVIKFLHNKIVITDSKSANGVYVGHTKIPRFTPYEVKDGDIIGIGWTTGVAPEDKLKDEEKFMFKITKEDHDLPKSCRFKYQSDNEHNEIEEKIAALDAVKSPPLSPVLGSKLALKRKLVLNCDEIKKEIKQEKRCRIITMDDDIVNLLSESDHESTNGDNLFENKKFEPICDKIQEEPHVDEIKTENEFLEFEAFNVKQEYLGYDDEPIKIESDSDSESEHWYLRLSQNSPGKPFSKLPKKKPEKKPEDSSYSQMDDNYIIDLSYTDNGCVEEEFMDDIITILPPHEKSLEPTVIEKNSQHNNNMSHLEEFSNDIIYLEQPSSTDTAKHQALNTDEVDGSKGPVLNQSAVTTAETPKIASVNDNIKKTQMIEPQFQSPKGKSKHTGSKSMLSTSLKADKTKKHPSSKKLISKSQKEERKKKLKEIATKEKEVEITSVNSSSSSIKTANVKITSSNRGAFLTNSVQVVKPTKRKEDPKETKSKTKSIESPQPENECHNVGLVYPEDRENKKNHSSKSHSHSSKKQKSSKRKEHSKSKSNTTENKSDETTKLESRVPLKSLKPLTESDETYSGKPFSKVDPLPTVKPKKKVRFSEAGPDVHLFEIEPGNQMRKTSTVKKSLVDIRQMPVFSLEKITLMKVLRWNPHWLEEQINNNDPPPILGHSNPPMSIFHSFVNHHQYVQLIGDLLLMEIWECLTLAYMKIRGNSYALQMQIGALPPMPTQERTYELFSLSVNISLPSHETKRVPRMGEILLITFGPENAKIERFFYVNNVRCLPSPPNNIHSFYSIGLHATYTEKMRSMRLGEVMVARTLAYISKELNLFEAMEYLAGSPLSEAILRPEPRHFERKLAPPNSMALKWTQTLNPSQQAAVSASVAAALGDKPCIQMVQGPPGTGKSSVICAIVMSYFYNEAGQRCKNRAKIMICATSNAAVDELVIRLLNIRQSLAKSERFRMVRVGRVEAMAARARDVSSQQLAQRDAARLHAAEPAPTQGHKEEISHLEAKINMWKDAAQNATDPVRLAYCQGRVNDLLKRIALVRAGGGGGEELRPDQLVAAERRIIEGADIIVTTLASAYNHKMRGLKRRIALCIIDEAGQAIEPETLLPLTLDVTKLTLIGDPQQLPGYICSQRAKKHGLGESLFSRLTSNSEHWSVNPVALLNEQYRMHADIADYPNRAFYGGAVRTAAPDRPLLPIPPYAILSISSGDKGQGACGANEMEAWGVSRLVHALGGELRARGLSLAVITPYHAHKDSIKRNLKTLQGPSEPAIEVNTVDSFQGQERDVVVVSLARSHGVGFLTDTGRMNVMLTRARHALVICLNPHAMLKNHQWRTLIEDAQKRKMYKMLPNIMCQPVCAGQLADGDILKYLAK